MVAVGEDSAGAAERSVHGEREARGERLHAARECLAVARLDEQVRVIALDGVLRESEVPVLLPRTERTSISRTMRLRRSDASPRRTLSVTRRGWLARNGVRLR